VITLVSLLVAAAVGAVKTTQNGTTAIGLHDVLFTFRNHPLSDVKGNLPTNFAVRMKGPMITVALFPLSAGVGVGRSLNNGITEGGFRSRRGHTKWKGELKVGFQLSRVEKENQLCRSRRLNSVFYRVLGLDGIRKTVFFYSVTRKSNPLSKMALFEQYRTDPLRFEFKTGQRFTFDETKETRREKPLVLTIGSLKKNPLGHRYVVKTLEDDFWFIWATAKGIYWIPEDRDYGLEHHFYVSGITKVKGVDRPNRSFPTFPDYEIVKEDVSMEIMEEIMDPEERRDEYTIFDYVALIDQLCGREIKFHISVLPQQANFPATSRQPLRNTDVLEIQAVNLVLSTEPARLPHISLGGDTDLATLRADFETFSITYTNLWTDERQDGLILTPFPGYYPENLVDSALSYQVLKIESFSRPSGAPISTMAPITNTEEDISDHFQNFDTGVGAGAGRLPITSDDSDHSPESPASPHGGAGRPASPRGGAGRPISPVRPGIRVPVRPRGGAGRSTSPHGGAGRSTSPKSNDSDSSCETPRSCAGVIRPPPSPSPRRPIIRPTTTLKEPKVLTRSK
jgi:hypothetical protein